MKNKQEQLKKIKKSSSQEQQSMPYEELIKLIKSLSTEEKIELANSIGYPVFTRMCMGTLKHDFVLLQDGAAIIIENEKGEILLQSRADRDKWGLPGGCQNLGERFEETIIRETKEETNLDILESDLELIAPVSGLSRQNSYPNGDVVINNTMLYYTNKYTGELKWDEESKKMKFFPLSNLPKNQNDPDLINRYIESKKGMI